MSVGKVALPRKRTAQGIGSWTNEPGAYTVASPREAAARDAQKQVVARRVEFRFGPDSDVAQMLGLVQS